MTDVRLPQHGRDHRLGGSDPIPGLGGPRIVYGAIDDDGNIVDAGSGDWSVSWDTDNEYTITVDPPFATAITTVLVTPTSNLPAGLPGAYFASADASFADVDTFIVYTFNLVGDAEDGSFAFAAIETPA